jgi:peptidoglycan hydrolase-like protein with peptidoglycan-binding domain
VPAEFSGNPASLTAHDFERAAKEIGCTVAAVRAVAEVESRGGFLSDGRPRILFERHKFHKFTDGRFSAQHSHISWPGSGGYRGDAKEYLRLHEAIALDRKAALKSASWGAFQLMGFHHASLGFDDVEDFVASMVSGEGAQLDAFVAFIRVNGLADELRRLDWAGFAAGYNGPAFRKNNYDEKMAKAYEKFITGGARTDNPTPILRMGDRGPAVLHLQELLGLELDGQFGPTTKAAVVAFQVSRELHDDGIVGQQTWNALIAKPAVTDTALIGGGATEVERSRPPLRKGDSGNDVEFLQGLLKLGGDGDFGRVTHEAVVAFQRKKKLTADGVVGTKTWRALLAK